jgi:DNA invertase Pin-like site-specific DNA recombinase
LGLFWVNEHISPLPYPKRTVFVPKLGYARTSTVDQNLDAQLAALRAAGCDVIRTEQKTGTSLVDRPELETLLAFIREGDALVVTRVDRLARSVEDLQAIGAQLKSKGADLIVTEQPIDTSTAMGKMFFDILAVFAEFETNLRRERQAEGIARAKEKGKYTGRKPVIDKDEIQRRLAEGQGATKIAREMGISRSTVNNVKFSAQKPD